MAIIEVLGYQYDATFNGHFFDVSAVNTEGEADLDAVRELLDGVYYTLLGSTYMPSHEWVEYEVASYLGQTIKIEPDSSTGELIY
jgi:hypothetical protein